MRSIKLVLDSGDDPNLIHLRCVAAPLRSAIKPARSPPFSDASNRAMKAAVELALYFCIGEFVARVRFLVVTNLVVDCILGTTFLDRHVRAILSPQRKVMLHHAPPIALTGTTTSRHDRKMAATSTSQQLPLEPGSTDRKRAPFPTNILSRKTSVVKGVTILPMNQAMVRVSTPVGGLCFLQNYLKTVYTHFVRNGQGCSAPRPR